MRRPRFSASLALPLLALLVACGRKDDARAEPSPPPRAPSASPSAPVHAGPVGVLAPRDQLRIIEAREGDDVAALVRETMAREAADGRKLLVYIGATWCEPCQRFHRAAARGELDKAFPDLTLLEFDADKDGERLVTANYATRLIPYFGVPSKDGRGTDAHIEGSIKGDGAVGEIAPRLNKLLGR